MNPKILMVYSTTDGHTRRICDRLAQVMMQQDCQVQVLPLTQASDADLAGCDCIVVGASIRYGKHQPSVTQFVEHHKDVLSQKPGAFFTVNVVARKPAKNRPDTNPYMLKFLRQITWKPRLLGVFAGRLDYQRYGVMDRLMIRLIMLITRGPTDPKSVVEFTDWAQVEDFGRQVCALAERPNDAPVAEAAPRRCCHRSCCSLL